MKIAIICNGQGVSYAVEELKHFLQIYSTAELVEGGADSEIVLVLDPTMPSHVYGAHGTGKTLTLTSGSPSALLCAVYEVLDEAGILFTANGHSAPRGFHLARMFAIDREVHPKCRLRGIRQHINFPMDISAYTLKDAKEYIRSIARMRMNAITFHSYPGQWHEARPLDPNDHAGHYFYGQVHPIPADSSTASRIENRRVFCIPEVEPIFEDEKKRSEFSKHWLNEVMRTAKEAYMTVTLSVEIPHDDADAICEMLHRVCKTYPLIDTLELITVECGDYRSVDGLTPDNVIPFMKKHLGEDLADEKGEMPHFDGTLPSQLGGSVLSLGRIFRAFDLRARWTKGLARVPQLRMGLYLTCVTTLGILRPILRRRCPENVTMSLLPAHGAEAVVKRLVASGTVESDWQRTMLYSWAEFDGNMYIQQLSTNGLEQITALSDAQSIYGICVNHWRTAENSLTLSYAAKTMIEPQPADAFYRAYAMRVGIEASESFASACHTLARLDTQARDELFNIGFCCVGCWVHAGAVTEPCRYRSDAERQAIDAYDALCDEWRAILPSAKTEEGIAFLRLMINRCEASALHIRAIHALGKIRTLYDYENPQPLTQVQKAEIEGCIAEARRYADAYLSLYGAWLPDRGGEGQLVSYYETIPVFIDAVAAHFREGRDVTLKRAYDAPPLPDVEAK